MFAQTVTLFPIIGSRVRTNSAVFVRTIRAGQTNLEALKEFAAKAAAKIPSRRGSTISAGSSRRGSLLSTAEGVECVERRPSKNASMRRTSADASDISEYLKSPQTVPFVFDNSSYRFAKRSSFVGSGSSDLGTAAAAVPSTKKRPTLLERRSAQLEVSKLIIADKRGNEIVHVSGAADKPVGEVDTRVAAASTKMAPDFAHEVVPAQVAGADLGIPPMLRQRLPSTILETAERSDEEADEEADLVQREEVRINISAQELSTSNSSGRARSDPVPAGTCRVCRRHQLPAIPLRPTLQPDGKSAAYEALCGWCKEDALEVLNTKRGRGGRWEAGVEPSLACEVSLQRIRRSAATMAASLRAHAMPQDCRKPITM